MSEMRTSPDGCKRWYDAENRLHRTDGPAEEWPDGRKCWHRNGVRHRVDGPAFENSTGYREWWIEGEQLTVEQFQQWQQQRAREQKEFEAMVDKVTDEGLDYPVKAMPKPEVVSKKIG